MEALCKNYSSEKHSARHNKEPLATANLGRKPASPLPEQQPPPFNGDHQQGPPLPTRQATNNNFITVCAGRILEN